MEQLVISKDENTVVCNGHTTTFHEIGKGTKNSCSKCWWFRFNCEDVPCSASKRKDGKEGVFTIQNMPNMKQAESVSFNEESADVYFAQEGIDIDSYVKKGLSRIDELVKKEKDES